ncbi:MAG: FHA domain-containing protein [Planctomycetota bacterium]|nr:FHA domain-containing protein [Planctomycetota bacterium]
MTPKLKVLHGKNAGHEIRLKGSKFLIGRGEECQLRPKSDAISRQHCEFAIAGDQVSVRDMGSKNGTLVNGTRIESSTSLNEGDEIQIGKLAFEIVGLAAEAPAAKKEKPAAMFTDQAIEDSDISAWLQEGDDSSRARELAEPETKQFRLEEADRDALDAAAESIDEDAEETSETNDDSSSEADSSKKKAYGKLPTKMPVSSTDSREAASDMLKKFFGRR